MKTCSKCKIERPKSEFCKNKNKKDGFKSQCKICDKEYRSNPKSIKLMKERSKRYMITPRGKEVHRRSVKKYQKTPKGIIKRNEKHRKWQKTPKHKETRRNCRLKRDYGITIEDYNNMLKKQEYVCAICSTDKSGGAGRFHIDHTSGVKPIVRGLLCSKCNPGLGLFNHDIKILAKAIQYLSTFDELFEQRR